MKKFFLLILLVTPLILLSQGWRTSLQQAVNEYTSQNFAKAYQLYTKAAQEARAKNEIFTDAYFRGGCMMTGCLSILKLAGEESKLVTELLEVARIVYGQNSVEYANLLDLKARDIWNVSNDLQKAREMYLTAYELKKEIFGNIYSNEIDWSVKYLFWVNAEMEKEGIEANSLQWASLRYQEIQRIYDNPDVPTYNHLLLIAEKYAEFDVAKSWDFLMAANQLLSSMLENDPYAPEKVAYSVAQSAVLMGKLGVQKYWEDGSKELLNPDIIIMGIEGFEESRWQINQHFHYYYLALTYLLLDQTELGVKYMNQAIKAHDDYYLEDSKEKAQMLYKFGWALLDTGHPEEGLQYIIRGLDIYSKIFNSTLKYLSEREQNDFFYNHFAPAFEGLVSAVMVTGGKDNEDLLKKFYEFRMLSKGIILANLRKARGIIAQSNDKRVQELFDQYKLKKVEYSVLVNDKEKANMLLVVKSEIDKLERQMNERIGFSSDSQITYKSVQESLEEKQAAIEIIRFRKHDRTLTEEVNYAAMIVRKDLPPSIVPLENGNAIENEMLSGYRREIITKRVRNLPGVYYNTLWAPLQPSLSGVNEVYISLDGAYHNYSLITLYNEVTGYTLGEEYKIRVVNKTTDIVKERPLILSNAVLFARPDYDLIANQNSMIDDQGGFSTRFLDLESTTWTDLPGTEQEVEAIEKVLSQSGLSVVVKTEKKASESDLKKVASPSVLHIATHGYFVPTAGITGRMQSSGLILAGAQSFYQNGERFEEEDGIFSAFEASMLDLKDTDLVVLSACESALGVVQSGEGVFGLQRAFQTAGSKYLLMSLWKVDDFATRDFMIAFYNSLVTTGNVYDAYAQAVSEMKLKYIQPYKWGAFILVGS